MTLAQVTVVVLVGLLGVADVAAQTLIGPMRSVAVPTGFGVSPDGDSFAPVFSADGNHIAFVSQANNLVLNDDAAIFLDVFVRDRSRGVTRLVSVGSSGQGGGQGNSCYPTISSNGQFIAFLSSATNLTANGTNNAQNLYLRDIVANTTTLISATPAGSGARGGFCLGVDMNPEGRYLVFSSSQTNLVTNSISLVTNIFLHDRQLGKTELVTLQTGTVTGAHGHSDFPVISATGNLVAFTSTALDLVSWNGAPPAAGQVYLRDRMTATTICIGTNAQQFLTGTVRSFNVALSSAGSAAAFFASAGSQSALVYYQITNGQAALISTNVDVSGWPGISADGQRVVYTAGTNVYVWDAAGASNILINAGVNGAASGVSQGPVISADGTKVAFTSSATNLTTAATNGGFQLFVRDLAAGITRLATPTLSGLASSGQQLYPPALRMDGLMIAFASADGDLVAGDRNETADVFTWSWNDSQVELISRREVLRPAATDRGIPLFGSYVVSTNGIVVAFTALDGNLVTNDTNGWADVFVRDLVAGTTVLVSGDLSGNPVTNGPSSFPSLSEDGRYVAFLRGSATTSQTGDVYLRDCQTGTLTLITATNGVALGNANAPVVSATGRYVAFHSTARLTTNDINLNNDVYLYDTVTQSNRLISGPVSGSANYESLNPIFSPDEQWLVFQSKSPNLVAPPLGTTSFQLYSFNLISHQITHVSYAPNGAAFPGDNTNAVFSRDSQHLVFKSATAAFGNPVCLHDLATRTNRLVCNDCFTPTVNGDGSKVTYSKTNSGNLQIYVTSVAAGQTNLVSVASDGVAFGNGRSVEPLLSSDGRFVIFSSKASNLIAGDTNLFTDIYVRDLVTSKTILVSTSRAGLNPENSVSSCPILAGDGRTIVFQSFASGLVSGDFDVSRDLFVLRLGSGDSDNDQMDDDWELVYFEDLAQDGSADSDLDGLTDLQEFLAGSNPVSDASVLRAFLLISGQGKTTVNWSAVSGRSYRVEYKDALNAANWEILVDAITTSTATGSVTDESATTALRRFYRVIALP